MVTDKILKRKILPNDSDYLDAKRICLQRDFEYKYYLIDFDNAEEL